MGSEKTGKFVFLFQTANKEEKELSWLNKPTFQVSHAALVNIVYLVFVLKKLKYQNI